jgi:hypothetical protein
MPAGIEGASNRQQASTVERQQYHTTLAPTRYGVGVVMDAATGTVRVPNATDTGASIYGLLVRPYPTTGGVASDPLGTGTVNPASGEANVMKRGYMTVRLYGAVAAVKGGPVNIGLGNAVGPGDVPGGITGTAPAAGIAAVLPGAYFMGPAYTDPNPINAGAAIVEIAYNI